MNARQSWLGAAVLGLLAVLTAIVLAVRGQRFSSEEVGGLVALIALAGIGLAAWKLRDRPTLGPDTAAPPWSPEGALVRESPERTPDDLPVSGTTLAHRIDAAAEAARRRETVAEGLKVVRPHLRETLVSVLVQSGTPRRTAADLLATGEWTDDREAAAVLDERVTPPRRPLRERLLAWLFPAKAVRRRTERAVDAIARVAGSELPTLVGQSAPRSVPVTEPTLEDLQRVADGTLRRAEEPLDGGPTSRPAEEGTSAGEDDGAATGDGDGEANADADADADTAQAGESR